MGRFLVAIFFLAACNDNSGSRADLSALADLATATDLEGDFSVEPSLDFSLPDQAGCPDNDGDGRSAVAGCSAQLDCDDTNPNVWSSCGTCVDADSDGFFTGCDAYYTVPADCDDSTGAITNQPEILGDGIDQDCDGVDGPAPGDRRIIYVSAASGNDGNDGSITHPVASLTSALGLATATVHSGFAARRFLFFADGAYDAMAVSSSISLYGGFTDVTWAPSGHLATINGELDVSGGRTTLQHLQVNGPSGGVTSYAMQIQGSVDNIVDCQVEAGIVSGSTAATTGLYINESSVQLLRGGVIASPAPNAYAVTVAGGSQPISVTGTSLRSGGTLSAHAIYDSAGSGALTLSGATLTTDDGDALDVLSATGALMISGTTFELLKGGVAVSDSTAPLTMIDNQIFGAANGGGIFYGGSQGCLFADNYVFIKAGTPGPLNIGVDLGGAASIINNTFYIEGGGGMAARISGPAVLIDNLMIGGNLGIEVTTASRAVVMQNNAIALTPGTAGYCELFVGGFTDCETGNINACTWTGCQASSGNVISDCGVGAGDFHISPGSACQSTGIDPTTASPSPFPMPFVDLDGQTRPQGKWDVGADEIPN